MRWPKLMETPSKVEKPDDIEEATEHYHKRNCIFGFCLIYSGLVMVSDHKKFPKLKPNFILASG